MRVAITGASGFIGSHLLRAFDDSADVVGVSRRATADGRLVRVADYADAPPAEVLVHLAENSSRGDAQHQGDAYERAAVATIERLVAKGFGRIVYVSSAAVYGDVASHAHPVTDEVAASDVYTRAKLACEARVLAAGGTVARVANLFGPGMSRNNVVSTILAQLTTDGPVRVIDDTPVRDFLWIGDAADALRLMTELPRPGVYNVGSGAGTSIRELARVALDCADQPWRDIVAAAKSGRPSCTVVDISATVCDLGWQPRTSLRDGLERLIAGVSSTACLS
jgi:nucleoside-diphosphate-sugar epimerase